MAIVPGKNVVYAIGDHDSRSALWEIDLTDKQPPQLLFSHPLAQADKPLLTGDGRLLGVTYELDRPAVYYVDDRTRALMQAVNQAHPASFNLISDSSADEKTFVIRSSSDVDAGTFLILDTQQNKLQEIGRAYPELNQQSLGHMMSIKYKAADGTEIPAYLTVPTAAEPANLPLVVMPHDGPTTRDSQNFSFLRAFLVDRGYAVLQMNFRGSSGYGTAWQQAGDQNWGGLSYSDITDATRWAVSSGVADPKRVCIAGWGYGGYASLLSAVRNSDLYKCAVSIGGVSDLNLLLLTARNARGSDDIGLGGGYGANAAQRRAEALASRLRGGFSQRQRGAGSAGTAGDRVGTDVSRLRQDSPVRYAEDAKVPVLLVHGDRDLSFDIEQSRQMDSALTKARKPHRAVFIAGASHELDRKSDRVTLLMEIEKFLTENIGPAVDAQ
ncbi:MAG TPA: prolyl oligopeptidase family serine peptidase, partial [Povalibacter sp.]